MENEKIEFKPMSKAAFKRSLRDMTVCPDCGTIQKNPKESGDECENEDCESFVIMWYGKLHWNNPNWG